MKHDEDTETIENLRRSWYVQGCSERAVLTQKNRI